MKKTEYMWLIVQWLLYSDFRYDEVERNTENHQKIFPIWTKPLATQCNSSSTLKTGKSVQNM